ncbi:hypothetical protein BDY24DRAFT_393700 [Mrakia frigida]|uniref:uncharacterized protein n=1 Tax=Mrakia frigida TaxID=29902 RepID=UPI003FCC0B22
MTSLLLLALVASLSSVQAHLQIASPFPYHSSLNPLTPEASKDYSMTAPLVSNGLPFPCKGYIGTTGEGPNQQWTAGQTVDVEIAGTAVHGGGSCQYSLSYDNGVNFHVIQSIIGGCNLDTKSFKVQIPSNAPAADNVIFAWTWLNKLGNREMYMNCLSADISSSSTTPLSGPTIFVANAAVNQCSTVEGTPVVFPAPGSVVTYGGEYAGKSIGNGLTSGAGVVGTDCYGPGSEGAGGAVVAPTTTKAATTAAATTKASTTSTSTSIKISTTSTKAATTSVKASSSAVVSVKASSAVVAIVLPNTSSSKSVAPATTVKTSSSSSTKAASTSKATTSSFLSVVTKATTSSKPLAATTSSKAVVPTTSSKAVVATTSTKAIVNAAPTATKAVAVKCTTGEWKCVGQVLTQCANDTWYSMADCVLQTGTVCSASTPIGCVWPFQVASGRKRHVGGHGKKRMLPSTPKLGALVV